jgi:HAD superfamily hydrolase (TIGR01549 family)
MSKAVIFDVDGTLLDSVDLHARAWQEAFSDFGKKIAFRKIRAQIGKGGDQLLPEFLSKEEIERCGKALQDYRADLFKHRYLNLVKPFPKVRDLFERLSYDQVKLALASSARPEELEHYEDIAGIAGYVQHKTSSKDASRSKPEPDIFEAALQRLGSPSRDEVLIIGDSPWDAIAAKRLGVRVIGVMCGGFPVEELMQAGCTAVYKDPAELLDVYPDWLQPSGQPLGKFHRSRAVRLV